MVKQNSSIAPPQPIHRTSNVSASSSTEKHCDPLPSGQLSTLSTHTPTLRQKLPPFIASHDITRGVLHTAQVAIGYALMLAVMYVCPLLLSIKPYLLPAQNRTFNGSFILSVLIGLGVGETLFGKYSRPL